MTWVVWICHKWSLIFAQVMLHDPKQPGVFGLHLFLVQPHMKVGLSAQATKKKCQEDLGCYSSLSRRPWKAPSLQGKKTAVDGSEIRRTPLKSRISLCFKRICIYNSRISGTINCSTSSELGIKLWGGEGGASGVLTYSNKVDPKSSYRVFSPSYTILRAAIYRGLKLHVISMYS